MIKESAERNKKAKSAERGVLCGGGTAEAEGGEFLTFPAECVSGNKYIRIAAHTWLHPVRITEDYRHMRIPQGLIGLISRWEEEARSDRLTFQPRHFSPECGEKNARLQFVWFHDYYELPCEVLGSTPEHFSCFAYRIVHQLQQLGCPYTRYVSDPE